jgi:rSAM/selenodomain-associated transferase 2
MAFNITVIIPTLNESLSLKKTLNAIKKIDKNIEIIVVDGGSSDDTISIAENLGVKVLHSERGRGQQLHTGAKAASGDVFWFLHADTIPSDESFNQMNKSLENPKIIGGNFTILFDGETRPAKFMSWLYPKLRKIGLIYGDSGIFVRREVYEKVGGFKPFPIFEDLDFVRRLKREGVFANLSATVKTSSRRFEGRSFLLMFSRWAFLQVLYWLGFSPNMLVKLYLPIRKRK